MNPVDREDFRTMLQAAVKPLQDQIDALKKHDEKFSGQHKLVMGELLPKMASDVEKSRAEDLTAIAAAVQKLVDVSNDTIERGARTDQNVATILKQNLAATVPVTTDHVTSIRPASLVAAESSVRTETATALMHVDVTTAQKQTAAVQTWQKRVTTPLLVLVPVLVEIYRQLFPHH